MTLIHRFVAVCTNAVDTPVDIPVYFYDSLQHIHGNVSNLASTVSFSGRIFCARLPSMPTLSFRLPYGSPVSIHFLPIRATFPAHMTHLDVMTVIIL